MRHLLSLAFGFGCVAVLVGQTDEPTAEEQAAITAVRVLKGAAQIDPALHKDARVAVKFDTATDTTLTSLAKYPQIGSVQSLDGTKCTEKGLAALKKLPNLRRLTLNKSGVSDPELAQIAGCPNLRVLVIPEATATDAGVAVAAGKLTRLEHLDLSDSPKVTDKGVAQLKKLERLEILYLNKTAVTDKGLAELKTLEGLRTLSVFGTKVTDAAAAKFADEMPNLRNVRK